MAVTLLDVKFDGVNRIPSFEVLPQTLVLQHAPVCASGLHSVLELCAGVGIATAGLDFVGFSTSHAVELRAPFAKVFAELHPHAKVITGDINDPQCVRKVLQQCPGSCALVAGFNCQPYSRAGAQKGILDPRASSLHGVLNLGFLLRCPIIILECVVEAASNRHVQDELRQFTTQCGYHMSDAVLCLESVWPCRRDRWWVVLSAAALGQIALKPLPQHSFPTTVKQILPRPMQLSQDDLLQLQIVGKELEQFVRFRPDLQSMMLAVQGKCPTLLHSLGSQASECLCGCREKGFAETTLAKGLYGIIMPVDRSDFALDHDTPCIRHPHPNEVALLSAVKPRQDWKCPHRLALAGIGQQANPIHALWIAAQVNVHLEFLIEGKVSSSPRALLDAYIEDLLNLCRQASLTPVPTVGLHISPFEPIITDVEMDEIDEITPQISCDEATTTLDRLPVTHGGNDMTCTVVFVATSSSLVLQVTPSTTVGELIGAESALHGPAALFEVVNPDTQEVMNESELVGGRCVWLRVFDLPVTCHTSEMDTSQHMQVGDISPTMPFVAVEVSKSQEEALSSEPAVIPTHVVAPHATEQTLESPPSTLTSPSDPLIALTAEQMIQLPAPNVASLRHVDALLAQTLDSETRFRILASQGEAWADDEIRWHLWQCMDRTTKDGVVMLDPLVATAAARSSSPCMLGEWFKKISFRPKIIISAVCLDNHWTAFVWTWTPECLLAHSWDRPELIPHTKWLHDALSKVVGARTYSVRVLHRMDESQQGCGVCAVRYIDHFLNGRMLPTTKEDIQYLSLVGKDLFRRHIEHAIHITRPWCWGSGLDPSTMSRLKELLTQHGVPSDQIEQRSHLTVQAIGVGPLQKCLTGSAPWRSIKALANQCTPVFQLVLPDELKSLLATKASSGQHGRKTKGKGAQVKSVPSKPPPLDPSKLTFDTGAFVTDLGAPLSPIKVSQLGPLAEGVALASVEEIAPFLKSGQIVSQQCLAVFVVNAEEHQVSTALMWSQARVALRCIANGEPMLLNGYLIQLGKKHVVQARTKHVVEVQSLPAACLKIAIYRDGVTCAWDDIIAAPIKYLLQCLEPLSTCSQDESCQCGKWHFDSKVGAKDPIFDLWRRQWLSFSMKVASPQQADLFMVNIRYAKAVETSILKLSGLGGVFLEPRSLDAREPVSEYQVLWMPKQTVGELLHVKQCNPGVLGLARLGARLGLRIHSDDMATLGKALKPEAIFLPGGPRLDFELGPVPFGLDRAGLARLCLEWGWNAKPINPSKAVAGLGAVWHIQSCTEPPSTVVSLKGGADVVISKVTPKTQSVHVAPTAIASAETIGLCKLAPVEAPTPDPWLLKDPWSAYAAKAAPAKVGSIDLETSLHQAEQRIERAVLAKLPAKVAPQDGDQDMDGQHDDTRIRLQELEEQVTRLTSGQQHLEMKVDEAGKKTDAQISQLQHQMTAQLEGQGARIEDLFRGQMAQIESLLTKKARHE